MTLQDLLEFGMAAVGLVARQSEHVGNDTQDVLHRLVWNFAGVEKTAANIWMKMKSVHAKAVKLGKLSTPTKLRETLAVQWPVNSLRHLCTV